MCMHKGELANINPPRITTEPIVCESCYDGIRTDKPRNIIHIDITSEPPTMITPPNNNCIALGSVILENSRSSEKRESEKKREHIRKRIPIKTLIAPFLRINCLTKIPVTDKRNTPNTIPTVCHAPNNIVLMSPPQPNNKIARNHTSGK